MRRKLLSFASGFFIVLALAGMNRYVLHTPEQGKAFASTLGLRAVFSDDKAQQAFLKTKIRYNPSYLLNIMGKDVQELFATPELVRQDLPTIIWQYRSPNCVLDVYFATINEDPLFTPVVHYEIRARDSGVKDENAQNNCMNELIEQRSEIRMPEIDKIYKAQSL